VIRHENGLETVRRRIGAGASSRVSVRGGGSRVRAGSFLRGVRIEVARLRDDRYRSPLAGMGSGWLDFSPPVSPTWIKATTDDAAGA
jgi:hypothetical protein